MWTPERVKLEALATVLAAAWYCQRDFFAIDLYLCDRISVLRYDIGSVGAIITNEDKHLPALHLRSSSPLHNAFVAELERTAEALRKLDLAGAPALPSDWHDCTDEQLAALVRWCGAPVDGALALDIRQLIALAFERKNPYQHAA